MNDKTGMGVSPQNSSWICRHKFPISHVVEALFPDIPEKYGLVSVTVCGDELYVDFIPWTVSGPFTRLDK